VIDLVFAQLALIGRHVFLQGNEVSQALERPREGDRLGQDGEATRLERGQQWPDHLGIDVMDDGVADEDVESIRLERRLGDVADPELDPIADAVQLGAPRGARDQFRGDVRPP